MPTYPFKTTYWAAEELLWPLSDDEINDLPCEVMDWVEYHNSGYQSEGNPASSCLWIVPGTIIKE